MHTTEDIAGQASLYAQEARVLVKYHAQREQFFTRGDRRLRISTAIAAIAAACVESSPTAVLVLLMLTVMLATFSIVARMNESAIVHWMLRREWLNLRFRWERLARNAPEMPEREASARFEEQLTERSFAVRRSPSTLDPHLLEKMRREVADEEGLKELPLFARDHL